MDEEREIERAIELYDPWLGGTTEDLADQQPAERPVLEVESNAAAAEWLRQEAGRGHLSGVFRRGESDQLVHTPAIGADGYQPLRGALESGHDGPAQVRPMDAQALAARVQYGYRVVRPLKNGGTSDAMFPLRAAQTATAAPDMLLSVRKLRGVIHTPIVRSDGELLLRPGYDRRSGLLYLPAPGLTMPRVPAEPSAEQVEAAKDRILWMLSDFPWESPHDQAGYIGSALLTPLMRDITPPPYKALAINARQPGSGKSLLATVARIIHGGIVRSEMPEDEPEIRKQVTSILDMTTGPVVVFDNVTGTVRSGTLAGLLTTADWDDRRLGTNEVARCANDRVWLLTGNNVQLGGDMIRRTVWASIDPGMPDPESRSGFKIKNLEKYARENRGQIIADLLTMIRAWIVAGMPGADRSSDGYAEWLRAVSGILSAAGVDGQHDAKEARQQQEGSDDQEWAEFMGAIAAVFPGRPWTAKDVLGVVSLHGKGAEDGRIPVAQLPTKIADRALRTGSPVSLTRTLGRYLANRKGRWVRGMSVVTSCADRNGTTWKIQTREECQSGV